MPKQVDFQFLIKSCTIITDVAVITHLKSYLFNYLRKCGQQH